MTLLLLLLFVLPITILVITIIKSSNQLVAWATQQEQIKLPVLIWLQDMPIIGSKLYNAWQSIVSESNILLITNNIQPYIGKTASWLLSQIANLGNLLLHCSLMILFSILLYLRGEYIGTIVGNLAIRLEAARGNILILLAVQAIRTVAFEVLLTATIQAILGGIGLAIAGIPLAIILTVIIFALCLIQLGPLPVLIPAIIWLYWNGDITWATILLVWSYIIVILDNILRLIFIYMGTDLPMQLVLCGMLGGLLAFGMIGLFIGPVILVVSWRLIFAWMKEKEQKSLLKKIDDNA